MPIGGGWSEAEIRLLDLKSGEDQLVCTLTTPPLRRI